MWSVFGHKKQCTTYPICTLSKSRFAPYLCLHMLESSRQWCCSTLCLTTFVGRGFNTLNKKCQMSDLSLCRQCKGWGVGWVSEKPKTITDDDSLTSLNMNDCPCRNNDHRPRMSSIESLAFLMPKDDFNRPWTGFGIY